MKRVIHNCFPALFSILVIASMLPACKQDNSLNTKHITVSILPQKYLVEQLCGDKFRVELLLPPGSNHETYEPTPQDIARLEKSQILFTAGYLDYERNWIPRFTKGNSGLKVINTSEGVDLISGEHHQHEGHSASGIDPHTWLAPSTCKIQAANIAKGLTDADPADSLYFRKRLQQLNQTIDSVDLKIKEVLASSKGKSFMIFHPALAYFAREYGLQQISIEEDGKEPSASRIKELIDICRSRNIHTILISKEFDVRNAEAIANEINGKVVVIDPMLYDWPTNLITIARVIAGN